MTEVATPIEIIQYIITLFLLIGTMYGLAYAIKTYLPGVSDMMTSHARKGKRLQTIEFLPVDSKNKVILLADTGKNTEYLISSGPHGVTLLATNTLDADKEKKNNKKS